MAPVGGAAFPFGALTYYPEKIDRMAYLTVFPVPGAMRANFMTYRGMNDPWLRRMRDTPAEALREEMPRLERLIGTFAVVGPVKIRPTDLYATTGHLQPGIVLVGDAFGTSCPAAGTGTTKVFTDVERLCNVHIPRWLTSGGMGLDKIATFYDDPVKRATDEACLAKAFWLRSQSTDRSLRWTATRVSRFAARMALAKVRQMRRRGNGPALPTATLGPAPAPRKTPEIASQA
jgi:2-polyprenyl-6-methoxyphenol hydroxylase-like FAD-dependent oxidoreductase